MGDVEPPAPESAMSSLPELLRRNASLFQNTAQGANGQFTVQWHNAAADSTVGRLSLQHDMTASPPDPHKAEARQCAKGLAS